MGTVIRMKGSYAKVGVKASKASAQKLANRIKSKTQRFAKRALAS